MHLKNRIFEIFAVKVSKTQYVGDLTLYFKSLSSQNKLVFSALCLCKHGMLVSDQPASSERQCQPKST